jgi:hypothetical protein
VFDILIVFARPRRFFQQLRERRTPPVLRAILIGLFCGWISCILGYLLTFAAWQIIQPAALAGLEDFALNSYSLYLGYLWLQLVAVPLEFLLHSAIAWILLHVFKSDGAEFRRAVVLVGFSRVSSLWRIIPFVGGVFTMIHYAVLLYLGGRYTHALKPWKALVLALVVAIVAVDAFVIVQF